tara:strand:+ start:74570 stop:75031 length:462 start_codon:yes stop_codon:yes gene_type:complete
MFHIVLYQPEIPPNTGNIIRLCANTQAQLHLIEPLGFSLSDKQMRRAGLDYHHLARIQTYPNFEAFMNTAKPKRCFALTTKATSFYTNHQYQSGDYFVFGPETRGLPQDVLDQFPSDNKLLIPQASSSRSLNLANCVSIVVYEALRQLDFCFQ